MTDTVQSVPLPGQPGVQIPLANLQQTFVYAGGFLATITVQYAGQTYVQTFTNNGVNITVISGWVQQ